MLRLPCPAAIATLRRTVEIQRAHWPCVQRLAHTIGYSYAESQRAECDTTITTTRLASLSVVKENER